MSAKPVEYFAVELRPSACPMCEPERFKVEFERCPRPEACARHLEHAVGRMFQITSEQEVKAS